MAEEILDLVDNEDNVIGQISREMAYAKKITNIRSVHFLLQNSEGRFWIPRRSKNKSTCPLGLDFSASGCVSSGEDYETALLREVNEELNLDLKKIGFDFLLKFSPVEHGTNAFCKLYQVYMDNAPDYNPEDFCEYFWLSPEELLYLIKNGEKVKSDLVKIVKLLWSK